MSRTVRLEYKDGSSDKFWQIDKETGLAEWGRNGRPPQGSKTYEGHEIEQMISAKIAKGYKVVSGDDRRMAQDRVAKKREVRGEAVNFLAELRKVK